eukprot:scaffold174786_cov22-Tisochrysis_lutea.AAC.2
MQRVARLRGRARRLRGRARRLRLEPRGLLVVVHRVPRLVGDEFLVRRGESARKLDLRVARARGRRGCRAGRAGRAGFGGARRLRHACCEMLIWPESVLMSRRIVQKNWSVSKSGAETVT